MASVNTVKTATYLDIILVRQRRASDYSGAATTRRNIVRALTL